MGWFSLFAVIIALAAAGFVLLRLGQRGLLTRVKSEPLDVLAAKLLPHTKIFVPEGDGAFPAVLMLHGCGGPRGNMPVFAELATSLGVVAYVPDSNAARGIGYEEAIETVCTGAKLRAHERTGDLHAILDVMRRDKRIDPDRIAIAGWSHGSWTALEALALDEAGKPPASLATLPPNGLEGVRAIWALYPYNGFPARSRRLPWRKDIPVESLLVKGDTICDDEDSVDVYNRQLKWGADVKWRYLDGVTHGFDEPDHHPTSTLIYDPEKAKLAHASFTDFLQRHLSLDQGSAD